MQKQGMELRLLKAITIAPSQSRIIPIVIEQNAPYFGESIAVDITFASGDTSQAIPISIPINQRHSKPPERHFLKATFFFANALPSPFIAIPPITVGKAPPILALRELLSELRLLGLMYPLAR